MYIAKLPYRARHNLALLVITILSGLQLAACAPAIQPAPPLFGPIDVPLGGEGLGFVEASSANGRLVIVRRWKAGVIPSFGIHGSPHPWPELILLDYVDGTENVIDVVVGVGPQRRWLLIQDDDNIVLIDSVDGARTVLKNIDHSSDQNACMPPRGAAFGFGEAPRIAWPGSSDGEVYVWDLEKDQRWKIVTSGRIWRTWPDASNRGAYVARVSADSEGWPNQTTSCACRWCHRFANISGYYGWDGPEFELGFIEPNLGFREVTELPEARWPQHGFGTDGRFLTAAGSGWRLSRGPWKWTENAKSRLVWEILNVGAAGRDLSGQDLSESSLRGADLRGADLSGANLYGTGLRRADLSGANLSGSSLLGADLSYANLIYANLSDTDLSGVILSNVILSNQSLAGANLSDARLGKADLSGADLRDANLSNAHLSGANLSGSSLLGADLSYANLIYANLSDTDLSGVNLSNVILSGANLSGSILRRADLSYANLSPTDLSRVNLSDADLDDANLHKVNLGGADLSGADLGGTNLGHAKLSWVNMSNADLREANLIGADLTGANLRNTNLSGARYYRNTTWPEGFDPVATGAVLVEDDD